MKSVHELSAEELAELKHNFFYGEERTFEELKGYDYPDEIPNKVIFDYYAETYFVEEDFFCNMVEEEESLIEKLKLTEQQVHSIVLEWYTNGMCREIFQTEDGEDLEEYLEPIVYH